MDTFDNTPGLHSLSRYTVNAHAVRREHDSLVSWFIKMQFGAQDWALFSMSCKGTKFVTICKQFYNF